MPEHRRVRSSSLISFFVAAAAALGGCAPDYSDFYDVPYTSSSGPQRSPIARAKIPLPDRAQLEPLSEPDCGTKQLQRSAALAVPSKPDDDTADLATRIKLEYERECFRQAEARARQRLKELQAATAQTIKAVKAEQAAR